MMTDEVDVRTQSSQNSRLEFLRLLGEVVGKSSNFGDDGVSLIVRLLESTANDVADHGKGQRDEEKH